jgi:hypothetical protein
VAYGWGVLILAGGGSYYFAKRSINSDRAERAAAEERRRQNQQKARTSAAQAQATKTTKKQPLIEALRDAGANPSREAGEGDPAPVTHEQAEMNAKSQYEAAEPFRSRKGDRFS